MGLRTVVYDCQVADSMRIVIAAQSGMTVLFYFYQFESAKTPVGYGSGGSHHA